MAEQQEGKGKPITVRPPDQATYDAITRAAERKGMSRGEWLLATAVQRLHGGPYPASRAEQRAARNGVAVSSAEAKANVRPIPKGGGR